MDEDGNIVRIIANLRDFDLMQKIREELDNVYHPSVIEKIDKDNPIIALSREFTRFWRWLHGWPWQIRMYLYWVNQEWEKRLLPDLFIKQSKGQWPVRKDKLQRTTRIPDRIRIVRL